mgnify:CR=1 FL=1
MDCSTEQRVVRYPKYRQWVAFKALLPLPYQLLCIACNAIIDWRAYDVARRGKRNDIEREQVAKVRVGALCEVRKYEWYIPANGTSEDIVESFNEMLIPFHAAGIGCPACQVQQSIVDAAAMREFEILTAEQDPYRTVTAIPFQFDPTTHLRLPTSISARTTYVRHTARRSPTKRIAYIDVTDRVIRIDTSVRAT